jgi:hypothetical protein
MTTPTIDASPTKDFFISIITRDVLLDLAIADLVDNCVDGAIRIRPTGDYKDLFVKIKFDRDSFSIEDNCGGIEADIAINYAFRFGRPPGMPETPGSVGQFGVGMKRSLFKMGNYFGIASIAPTSDFILNVNVEDWAKKVDENGKEIWEFEFEDIHTGVSHDLKDCGTTITVKSLHTPIAEEFEIENFKLRLMESLRSKHEESLAKGLVIEVGSVTLSHDEAALLLSEEIKPIHVANVVKAEGKPDVLIDTYAGIVEEANEEESGWYISCNGRLILKADKTKVTGWDATYDDLTIPKAHYQFARFRGYVRFHSDSAARLPWNTTKSGLDTESPVYQSTRLEMVGAMRQVIDFLNKLDAEIDAGEDFLMTAIKAAKLVKIAEIPQEQTFIFPTPRAARPKPKSNIIRYSKPAEEIDLVKELLGVTTAKEVGEGTFDYYLSMEGGDGR